MQTPTHPACPAPGVVLSPGRGGESPLRGAGWWSHRTRQKCNRQDIVAWTQSCGCDIFTSSSHAGCGLAAAARPGTHAEATPPLQSSQTNTWVTVRGGDLGRAALRPLLSAVPWVWILPKACHLFPGAPARGHPAGPFPGLQEPGPRAAWNQPCGVLQGRSREQATREQEGLFNL